MNQASYDLARLSRNGLIARIPGKNRYRLTGDGLRYAIFYTKVHDRLLRPLLAADQPPAPPIVRKALHTIDIHINEAIDRARLLPNAA
jgi:Mn-dependent DtxR family transcriptional regulator